MLKKENLPKKSDSLATEKTISLALKNANQLAQLPLVCIQKEFPNKLDHIIYSSSGVEKPQKLHPAFYGCFDWYSSVHAHWFLVRLLK